MGVQVAELRQDFGRQARRHMLLNDFRIGARTFFGVYEVVVGWCRTVAETGQSLVAPSCAHVRPVRGLGVRGVCGRACSCWKTPVSAQARDLRSFTSAPLRFNKWLAHWPYSGGCRAEHALVPRIHGEPVGFLACLRRLLRRRPDRCAVNGLA